MTAQSVQTATRIAWWRGSRGEWYVFLQLVLASVVLVGPRSLAGWPSWSFPWPLVATTAGVVLIGCGAALVVAGIFKLGSNLTAVPRPKDSGTLVQTGPYAIVRHPMYSGAILIAFGWALHAMGWLTLGYAAIFALFFDVKSRREERWLAARYPGYADYQRRVRKLIPFLY